MRKKLITRAVVIALCAGCVLGAAACNKGDGSGNAVPDVGASKQVDETGWKAAFAKTLAAKNFTFQFKETYSATGESSTEYITVYRWNNQQFVDDKGDYMQNGVVEKGVYKAYEIYEDGIYYNANTEEGYWSCWAEDDIDESFISSFDLKSFRTFYEKGFAYDMESIKAAEAIEDYDSRNEALDNCFFPLSELYSQFNFSDGIYAATLIENIKEQINNESKYIEPPFVNVKINEEGYLSYLSVDYAIKQNGEKDKIEFTLFNYGTTTYNVPAEAIKAVSDYKAQNKS